MLEPWIPLLSALVSGVVVKTVDHAYVRQEKQLDDATAIRQELRAEVRVLSRRLETLQQELDVWKTRYYELTSRYQTLLLDCQSLRTDLHSLQHPEGQVHGSDTTPDPRLEK